MLQLQTVTQRRPRHRLTAEEFDSCLNVAKSGRASNWDTDDKRYAELRDTVENLRKRHQLISTNPTITRPELIGLRGFFDDVRHRLGKLEAKSHPHNQATGEIVSARKLLGLLTNVEEMIEYLEGQLWLIDSFSGYAPCWYESVEELRHSPHCSPGRLQNLARRILLDARQTNDMQWLLPGSETSLANVLIQDGFLHHSSVAADSLQAARLIAWSAGQFCVWEDRLELLIMAALLSDVGLLNLIERHDCDAVQLRREKSELYREHPGIGAGLTFGLREFSTDLAALVGQHHERLDGTGSPKGLRSRNLALPSRLLAIVCRFVELRQMQPKREVEIATGSQLLAAANKLNREAAQGELDQSLTTAFLESLDFNVTQNPNSRNELDTKLGRSPFGTLRLRIDQPHAFPAIPHVEVEREKPAELEREKLAVQQDASPAVPSVADSAHVANSPEEPAQSQDDGQRMPEPKFLRRKRRRRRPRFEAYSRFNPPDGSSKQG